MQFPSLTPKRQRRTNTNQNLETAASSFHVQRSQVLASCAALPPPPGTNRFCLVFFLLSTQSCLMSCWQVHAVLHVGSFCLGRVGRWRKKVQLTCIGSPLKRQAETSAKFLFLIALRSQPNTDSFVSSTSTGKPQPLNGLGMSILNKFLENQQMKS